jgi:hypothetical protein
MGRDDERKKQTDKLAEVMDQIKKEQDLAKLMSNRHLLDDFPENIDKVLATNDTITLMTCFSLSYNFEDAIRIAEKLVELDVDIKNLFEGHPITSDILKEIESLIRLRDADIELGLLEILEIFPIYYKTGALPEQYQFELPALTKETKRDIQHLTTLSKTIYQYDRSQDEFMEFFSVVSRIAQTKHPEATQFLLNLGYRMRSQLQIWSHDVYETDLELVDRIEIEALEAIRNEKHPVFSNCAVNYINRWPEINRGWNSRALRIAAEVAIRHNRTDINQKIISILEDALGLWSNISMNDNCAIDVSIAIDTTIDSIVKILGEDAFKILYQSYDEWYFENVWKHLVRVIEKHGGNSVKAILQVSWYDQFEGEIDWPLFSEVVKYVHTKDTESSMLLVSRILYHSIKQESIDWVKSLGIRFRTTIVERMLRSENKALQVAACNYLVFFPRSVLMKTLRELLPTTDIDGAAMALAAIGNSKDLDPLVNWLTKHYAMSIVFEDKSHLIEEIIGLVIRNRSKFLRDVKTSTAEPDVAKRWNRIYLLAFACIASPELLSETKKELPVFYDVMFTGPFSGSQIPSGLWDFWHSLDSDRIDVLAKVPELISSAVFDYGIMEKQIVRLENPIKFLEIVITSPTIWENTEFKTQLENLIPSLAQNVNIIDVLLDLTGMLREHSITPTSDFTEKVLDIFLSQDADILGRNPELVVNILTLTPEIISRTKVIDKTTCIVESTINPKPLFHLLRKRCIKVLHIDQISDAFSKREVWDVTEQDKDDDMPFAPW